MQLMPALLLGLRVNDFAEARQNNRGNGRDTVVRADRAMVESNRVSNNSNKSAEHVGPHGREGNTLEKQQERLKPGSRDLVDGGGGSGDEEGVPPSPSAEERRKLETWGMDWGVVTVWSCPSSCDLSCEEAVVVQPPV